jgi:hypothetical protein
MADVQTSEVDENLHQSMWGHEGLSLVIMLTTPFSYDSLTHTCATVGPIVGHIV